MKKSLFIFPLAAVMLSGCLPRSGGGTSSSPSTSGTSVPPSTSPTSTSSEPTPPAPVDDPLMLNLNKALENQEKEQGEAGKNYTMHDAILDLKNEGFDYPLIIEKAENDLLWNQINNRFCLLDNVPSDVRNYDLWHLQNDVKEQKFSIYAGPQFAASKKVSVSNVGFDTGFHDDLDLVEYKGNDTSRSVSIRTSGNNLEINAPKDSVYHYGESGVVTIKNIASNSYHENGDVYGFIEIDNGRIVFEKQSDYRLKVNSTSVTASNEANANVELYSDVALDPSSYENIDTSEVTPVEALDTIENFEQLLEAVNDVNSGKRVDPVLVLSSKEYQFTQKLEIQKSLEIVGTPGYTVLKGYGVKDKSEGGVNLANDPSVHAEAFYVNTQGNDNVNIKLSGFISDHFATKNEEGHAIKVGDSTRQLSFIRYSANCPDTTTVSVQDVYLDGTDRTFIDMLDTFTYSPKANDGCAGTLNLVNVTFDATDRLCDNINAINALGKVTDGTNYRLHINVDKCLFKCAQALYASQYSSTAICTWGDTDLVVTNSTFIDCETGIYSAYANYWWNVNLKDKLTTSNLTFTDVEYDIVIEEEE